MKILRLMLVLAAMSGSVSAEARSHYHSVSTRSYSYHRHSYGYQPHRYYTNVSGHRVHSPTFASSRPAGASAHCGDGSWSFSEHARGTCSHHGGVSSW